ncbi:homing endonuclease associated repeat-containing protein [Clavibacter sepedonicus]|uniref:homing endonuclease associated repeat-containing protein n=2 Tax=Clavibacter sepedonicus TaxID=31964 RepID=UPI003DA23416
MVLVLPVRQTPEAPEWLRLYREDLLTLDEVGLVEGVTREAIRRRLRALGISPRSLGETLDLRRLRAVSEKATAMTESFLRLRDLDEVAADVGLQRSWVARFISETVPDYAVLTRVPRLGAKRYSNEELIGCLQAAAVAEGRTLSAQAYQRHAIQNPRLEDGRPAPGMQVMAIRFGSWRSALEAAGLPANPHSGQDKRFDEATAVAAVISCWRETGRPPTAASYDEWQRSQEIFPSGSTVRNLCGSWNALLLRAWQMVHGIELDQHDSETSVPEPILRAREVVEGSGGFVPYVSANEGADVELPHYFAENYAGNERAVRSHARIQNAVAVVAEAMGFQCLSSSIQGPRFDLALPGVRKRSLLKLNRQARAISNIRCAWHSGRCSSTVIRSETPCL